MNRYVCSVCGKIFQPEISLFRCDCGGLLDLERCKSNFNKEDIIDKEWSLFRYLKALPFSETFTKWRDISMGEGMSPLIPFETGSRLLLKLDFIMPTLSFKDRGAVVLISKAIEMGVTKVIQDSSGNAGTSIAAYAGRAGMKCDIYVPMSTSPKKIKQIGFHGANVIIVEGTREDTAKAALEAAIRGDGFYASHVYNPFFYEGTKTFAYEIAEQLSWKVPEYLFIPVGNGTLVLGAYYGFSEMLQAGLIDTMPKIIAVQAEGCAPIYKAFINGNSKVDAVVNTGTEAEGIAIALPMRGNQILKAVRKMNGEIIIAPEKRINESKARLAEKGLFVETTTAATYAGYLDYIEKHNIRGTTVIHLCGAGLKSA